MYDTSHEFADKSAGQDHPAPSLNPSETFLTPEEHKRTFNYLVEVAKVKGLPVDEFLINKVITLNPENARRMAIYATDMSTIVTKFTQSMIDEMPEPPKGMVFKTNGMGIRCIVPDPDLSDATSKIKVRAQSNKKVHKRKKAKNGR